MWYSYLVTPTAPLQPPNLWDLQTKAPTRENQCELCARRVQPHRAYDVEVTTEGRVLNITKPPRLNRPRETVLISELNGSTSQGCFLVGPECIKRLTADVPI